MALLSTISDSDYKRRCRKLIVSTLTVFTFDSALASLEGSIPMQMLCAACKTPTQFHKSWEVDTSTHPLPYAVRTALLRRHLHNKS